jgi:hypothetical protein
MADDRRFELDDLTIRPGTYFNPQTEVLIVVDDSQSMDNEIFNFEEFEGADWVLISDDVPVDEDKRDQLLETFQATYHGGDGRETGEPSIDDGDDEPTLEPDEVQPGDE